MFGWRRKKLLSKMENLTHAAQMIVFVSLADRITFQNEKKELQQFYAAAMANYLFGRHPHEQHKKIINLDEIEEMALQWLRLEDLFQEFIVQSLRVSHTIAYAKKEEMDEFSIHPALAEFGKNSPILLIQLTTKRRFMNPFRFYCPNLKKKFENG